MSEMIVSLFANNAKMILFFHVISAIVWVGGMLLIKFVVSPSLDHIQDVTVRLSRKLEILYKFFNIVIIFIVILVATALFMAIGLGLKQSHPELYMIVHIKEAIWTIMTAVFSWIYILRNKAERLFVSGDHGGAKQKLQFISQYLLPLNILLGLLAVYLGITLRGF